MIATAVAAALWALAASVLLSIVLGALVAGANALIRPAAAIRGTLWSMALAAAAIAPVAILAVMLVRAGNAAGSDVSLPPLPATHAAARPANASPTTTDARAAVSSRAIVVSVPGPPAAAPLIGTGIIALWALGALIGLAGLGRSLARVRGLKVRSSPLDGPLATELPWLTTTPGREIYLRLSFETETPIAVGFRRPVILLPTDMATAEGLTSIEPLIMHEYAHLARYDDWTNLAQRITERVFWFNPLMWILGRRIALEREVAADEAVVSRTRDAKRYASTLWRMAQEMRMPEHVVVAPGAMLTRKQISVRIERLLDERPTGQRYAGAAALAIAIVAASGVTTLAATARPIVLAQAVAEPSPLLPPPPTPPILPKISPPYAKPIAGDWRPTMTRERLKNCMGCDFSKQDLRGLDLSNLTITGDDFTRANLRGVNFSHSRLAGLDFSRADLRQVNFHGAKIVGVDLSHAMLDGSDLSDALLVGVDLSHASMSHVNTSRMRAIAADRP